MSKALQEIIEVFEKWNVDIQLVFLDKNPQIDFSFEDEDGISHLIEDFWEGRIKSYHLESYKGI